MSTSSLCFVKRVVVLFDLHTQCLTAYSCDNHGAHVLDLGMSFCPSHSGNHSEWKWNYMRRGWKISGICWAACTALWQFSKVTKNELTIWLHCEWSPGNQLTRRFTGACTVPSPYKLSAARPRFDQMCAKKTFILQIRIIHPTAVLRSESCWPIFALKWPSNSMLDLQRKKNHTRVLFK